MNIIIMSLIIFIAVNLFCATDAQNSTKTCKFNKDSDTCLMHLLLLGDEEFKFPENSKDMSKHCKTITGHENCIKEYSNKCLSTFPRQVTRVLAYGVAKTNKGYCTNRRRKDSFIAIGKCANKVKPEGDACMRQYIDSLQGIENYNDSKLKIPLSCCHYYQLKSCILNAVERYPKQLCPESNFVEIERIIDGYAIEVLNLLCGDYTEDSDKCAKIMSKTPKRLPSQRKPRSMLLPFINILSSVPQ